MDDEQPLYRIEYFEQRRRGPFGEVIFRIFADDRMIARATHDYRGEEVQIEFLPYRGKVDLQFSRASEFIAGGGPEPLSLTPEAVACLEKHRARDRA